MLNEHTLSIGASIATIVSLYFVFLAAIASRKQNILSTVPILTIMLTRHDDNEHLSVVNINHNYAYDFKSEPYFVFVDESDMLGLYRAGKTLHRLKFHGSNFIAPDDATKPLSLMVGGKEAEPGLRHYLFARFLKDEAIYFFYKDSQNHRFIAGAKTEHDDSTINNQITFHVVSAPRYVPWYALHIWIWYAGRTCMTYVQIMRHTRNNKHGNQAKQ